MLISDTLPLYAVTSTLYAATPTRYAVTLIYFILLRKHIDKVSVCNVEVQYHHIMIIHIRQLGSSIKTPSDNLNKYNHIQNA